MDVRLPDGTIVTNVPEGITQAELMRRLGKTTTADTAARAREAGVSMRDGKVNWGVELEKQDNADMSQGERLFKSMGAGFADIPLAIQQIFNRDPERAKQLQRQVADKREVDKDLAAKTNMGILPDQVMGVNVPTLGDAAQTYGKTAPAMLVPPTRLAGLPGFLANVGVGAGLAALDPVAEGESRVGNMAVSGVMSGVLPLTMSAVRGGYNMVTGKGAQQRAASDVAKAVSPDGDERVVLQQTIDRLKQAQPNKMGIPLSTAAQLGDAELARLEAGSRARNGANWYDFDQNQARSVSDALRQATAQADEVGTRRALRSSNRATNFDQAMSTINEPAFIRDIQGFRQNLEGAMRTAESSNPAVLNMLNTLRNEIDRLGPDLRPEHLATIRANLASKAPLVPQNAFQAAPRESPATMSVLREVDNILNNATGNRWQKVVSDYARDSDSVRAAQAAGKVREAFWDSTGNIRKKAADAAGDVPIITEFGLRQAINSTNGPQKNILLSSQANDRLNAIVDALRAQGIVQGVKRSATAGGGSNTASDLMASKAAGMAADAIIPGGGPMTTTVANKAIETLRGFANARKDKALAEALQNPQQMIDLLEAKIRANAPLSDAEKYLYSTLRQANVMATTSN